MKRRKKYRESAEHAEDKHTYDIDQLNLGETEN